MGFRGMLWLAVIASTLPALYSDGLDPYLWPKWAALSFVSVGALLLTASRWWKYGIFVPFVSKSSWIVLVGLAYALVHTSIIAPEHGPSVLQRILLFTALTLLAAQTRAASEELVRAVGLCSLVTCLHGFWSDIQSPGTDAIPVETYGGFLGHANLAAQVIGVSLVARAHRLSSGARSPWLWMALALELVGLILTRCRSVQLGALASVLLMLVVPVVRKRESTKTVIALLMLLALPLIYFGIHTPKQLESKSHSASYRVEMWSESLSMIRDHPLGVGVDQFGFAFNPYKRSGSHLPVDVEIDPSPHNEFLRVAAVWGIPGLLLGLLLAAFALLKSSGVWTALFPLFLSEAVFQFPTFVPFGFLVLCVWLAQVSPTSVTKSRAGAGLIGGAALLLVALSARIFIPDYRAGHYRNDPELMRSSCELNGSHWRSCTFHAEHLMTAGDLVSARALLEKQLKTQPFHHPSLRLLAGIEFSEGHLERGCLVFFTYNYLFFNQSQITGRAPPECKPLFEKYETEKTPNPFI